MISKTIIIERSPGNTKSSKDTVVISFQELARWIKSGKYWRHLFRYRKSTLMENHWEALTEPFGTAMAVYLLSRGTASVEDKNGNTTLITLPLLFRLFKSFIRDFVQTPGFLNKKKEELAQITNRMQVGVIHKPLNLSFSPIYLRTDYVIDLNAGGSVGHTAGVLNHLSLFTGTPLFLTSVIIPMVNRAIETHCIPPSRRFMDFKELMYLEFNDQLQKTARAFLTNRKVSFIYQRYSTHNYSGIQLSQNFRLPFVLEYNGSEIWINKNWGRSLKYEKIAENIEMLNLRGADVVVVVSSPSRDELIQRGIDSDKILVNPNGVDPEIYSPKVDGSSIRSQYQLEDKTVIGFIGTFGKWHGAEILAEAFGLLIEKHPEYRDRVRLLMIGDGHTMSLVRQTLEKHSVAQECILTGIVPQEEGPSHLAACDILTSPHVPNPDGSPFFGSPTKLFEYMAMGKGIVASDLDQIGEVLEHDRTAWMVKPGDAESLMLGLKYLIDNPEPRQRLGEAARQDVIAKYTWKEHTRKIIEKLKERCPCD